MSVTRGSDDEGLRRYDDGENSILSVTTVLKWLEEDTSGLDYWRDKNDGSGDAAYWQHIFWYSGPRGTICHYEALKQFEDNFDEGEEMWGEEEAQSMAQIVNGPAEDAYQDYDAVDDYPDAPTEKDAVTYSILKDQGIVESREQYEHLFRDSTRLEDVLQDDVDWFLDRFERVCEELGVDNESVIAVEKYVHDNDILVAGQADMVYEDPEGNVVVADLKTSSGLRQKHRLQSIAYREAVSRADWADEVDRVEVWRLAPSKREYQVHSHQVPDHAEGLDWYTDENWFVDPYGDFTYESTDEMWETFSDLAEEAHDDAGN